MDFYGITFRLFLTANKGRILKISKEGGLKKTRSRTQWRIQKILVGGMKV